MIELLIIILCFISMAIQKQTAKIWKWKSEAIEDFIFAIILGSAMMFMIVYFDFK